MQQSKFQLAEELIQNSQPSASTPNNSLLIVSPKCVQSGPHEYYKQKFENAMELIQNMSDEAINLEVAGVIKLNKIKPRETRKPVCLTQVCGSMEGKSVCDLLQVLQHQKMESEIKKKNQIEKKENQKEKLLRCKVKCTCESMKSVVSGLKQCPSCHDVMQSVCSKAACKDESGGKPKMILVKFDEEVKTRKGLLKRSI